MRNEQMKNIVEKNRNRERELRLIHPIAYRTDIDGMVCASPISKSDDFRCIACCSDTEHLGMGYSHGTVGTRCHALGVRHTWIHIPMDRCIHYVHKLAHNAAHNYTGCWYNGQWCRAYGTAFVCMLCRQQSSYKYCIQPVTTNLWQWINNISRNHKIDFFLKQTNISPLNSPWRMCLSPRIHESYDMHGNCSHSSNLPSTIHRQILKQPFSLADTGIRAYEPIGIINVDVSPRAQPGIQRKLSATVTPCRSRLLSATHTSLELQLCPRHGIIIWWFFAGHSVAKSLGCKYGFNDVHGIDGSSDGTVNFAQIDCGVCRVPIRDQSIHSVSKS